MKKLLKIILISAPILLTLYFAIAFVLTFLPDPTFATAPFPAPATAAADFTPREFATRTGETLFARHFPADSDLTILLIHGVTADSTTFNRTAPLLQRISGAEVFTLDLRGHGQSTGRSGDIDYIGQYQEDIADVITALRAEKPNGRLILAGHSMGGGIALQFAQLTERPTVDGYLLFAPHLGTSAPTMPPSNPETADLVAAYTQLHLPRLIGLTMLNAVGIKALNGLDTLFFNTAAVTHTYSYRAMVNSSPTDYTAALSAVDAPLLVIVGRNDEAFVAAQFPPVVTAYSNGEVHLIDGETHNSILHSTAAMTVIESWLKQTQFMTQN
ncbi:MAG: alpha/beta fold hydrolase [Anaerolineales bacterium]|nr:alpha/beta fold hydrolase [Anaerolineales bacterium]